MKRVSDIMIKEPIMIGKDAKIRDVVALFSQKHISCLPIVEDDKTLIGFISAGDVIHYVLQNANDISKSETRGFARNWYELDAFSNYVKASIDHPIMNFARRRVFTVTPEISIKEASRIFNKKQLKHMPVTEDGKVVGLVTRNDIVTSLFEIFLEETED